MNKMRNFSLNSHAKYKLKIRFGIKATKQTIKDIEDAIHTQSVDIKEDIKGNHTLYLPTLKMTVVYDKRRNEVLTVYTPKQWIIHDTPRKYYTTDPSIETSSFSEILKEKWHV
jgi:hypothetical protein